MMSLGLLFLAALPLLAVGENRSWDPRYARLMGISKDAPVQMSRGATTGAYSGRWDCPWHLDWFECADGEFFCTCTDGRTAKFSIGCCYSFPNCGNMCHNWNCYRFRNCATCRGKVSEWDMNACSSCKKGFIYESGLCDTDKNECADKNGGCEQKCHNTYGSYYCTCVDGFSMNADKHTCTHTCTKVSSASRTRCPNTDDRISKDKCLQLGCCHDTNTADTPTCYINPVKSYIRFGGISPVVTEEKGFRTYNRHSVETCTHLCQNTHGAKCKSFGVKNIGKNDTHGIEFNDCYMLPKGKKQMEDEGKIITNDKYDIYEAVAMLQITDSRSDGDVSKQYVGCFKDESTSHDLPHHVTRSMTHMDPATCVSLCRAQRYKNAGVQNGADCYCGNEFYRKYGESESCNVACSGDSELVCGGITDNSVYTVAWTDKYEGCYNDDEASRDLPFFVWGKDASRSAAECMDECVKRDYRYAGLQDGGACYCGNTFGRHGTAEELSCSSNCYGYSRQNCGGPTYNAIYKTKMVSNFDAPGFDPYRLYDMSGSLAGFSTSLFTFYPSLQSIISKRLIIQSGSKVLTPADDVCGEDCYKPCGGIHQESRVDNKGSDVTLRFFYINLSELDTHVGTAAKRVFVHAQTVIIDHHINLRYSLFLRAKTIIMDRSRAYYINVPSDAKPFDIVVDAQKFMDPEADTLHQKQSVMCAQILLDTMDSDNVNTAFSILNDIAQTKSQSHETQGVATTARNLVVELAGLARDNVHFVPFYTKAHLKKILNNYFEAISIYEKQLENLLDENNSKEQILEYTEGMHDIYSDTNILEANTEFEAAIDAVDRSNATYHRFRKDYNESRDELEKARLKFEEGLEEKKNWEIGRFLIDVIASIAKSTLGTLEYDKENSDEDIDGIKINIKDLWGLMQELSETIAQIDALSEVADRIIVEIEFLENEFDAVRYYDEVEMAVQLQVNIIKWQNLKNYGETLLSEEDVAAVRGCSEYHRHLLDVCNWGEALTRSMVERSEMLREAMEKRTILDLKKEQKKRIDEHIQGYRDDLYSGELLITEMVEQSYDIRLDLNEALLTFCQAYYYENMFECNANYKPSFGGSLEDLLLKINSAKRDDLLVGVAPSTLKRYITIEDTDTDLACNDALVCPINYLRNNRVFYFTVPTDHEDLSDMDAYKVSEIILTINGAKSTTDNKYLKLQIESSGYFKGRADNVIHNFMTRALSLAFEYDITSNYITVHADVYQPYRNIIQHITPFTTWVMHVSDIRSKDIDLSDVTSVRIQFNGSGVDNETWKKFSEAHGGYHEN